MSLLDEIDPDNYAIAFNESGGGIYDINDPSKAYLFDVSELTELTLGTKEASSGLLPPVTRFFTPKQDIFILERQPTVATITYDEKKYSINLPWHCFLVILNQDLLQESKLSIDHLFLYFNPTVSFTEKFNLYTMPFPITDSLGKVNQVNVDKLNNLLKSFSTKNMVGLKSKITYVVEILSQTLDTPVEKTDFNKELLQDELRNEYDDFHKYFEFLSTVEPEKLCLLTYQPIKVSKKDFDVLNQKIGNSNLTFELLIKSINSLNTPSEYNSLLDFIKSIVKNSIKK